MQGGGTVKGWSWGSCSHTNIVVALLYWKGRGVCGSPMNKLGKMEYLVHSRQDWHVSSRDVKNKVSPVMEEILSSLPFWEEIEETKKMVQNHHPNFDFPI